MKAAKTFYIGVVLTLLYAVQFILSFSLLRLAGVAVGVFFIVIGWKVGWTRYKNFTTWFGHIALIAGCLITAYAIYQIPFLKSPPTFGEILEMPLFWGFFIIFGGYCMITHGYCSCAIKMHEGINCKKGKTKIIKE